MSMHAAARVGDPVGHEFGAQPLAAAFGRLLQAGPLDGPARIVDIRRMLVRGISGGRFMASDGELTVGSRDVFINGRPATMTVLSAGTCRQHAGLRTVVRGSVRVAINDRQAARVADSMDCDAVILSGSPDVFIGTGTPLSTCELLGADAAKIAQFLVEAQAAEAAYDPPDTRQPPPGMRNATEEDLRRLSLTPAMLEHPIDPSTGEPSEFRAAVFIDEATGAPLVAFKGTTMESWSDWKTNALQAGGFETFYYNQAQEIGDRVVNAPGGAGAGTRFVGHSLGGGQASAAARATGRPATTFNAAGLNPETVADALPSEIDGVYVKGEILRGLQSATRAPDTAETRAWPLEPDEPSLAEGTRQAYQTDGIVAAGKYAATRSINLHLMDEVIPALELRARSLDREMVANGC